MSRVFKESTQPKVLDNCRGIPQIIIKQVTLNYRRVILGVDCVLDASRVGDGVSWAIRVVIL